MDFVLQYGLLIENPKGTTATLFCDPTYIQHGPMLQISMKKGLSYRLVGNPVDFWVSRRFRLHA